MVVVAVVALGIWGEAMRRRRAYCLEMAEKHRRQLSLPSFRIAPSGSPDRFSLVRLTAQKQEELRKTNPHAGGWVQGFTAEALETLRRTDRHAAWHLNVRDAYLRC